MYLLPSIVKKLGMSHLTSSLANVVLEDYIDEHGMTFQEAVDAFLKIFPSLTYNEISTIGFQAIGFFDDILDDPGDSYFEFIYRIQENPEGLGYSKRYGLYVAFSNGITRGAKELPSHYQVFDRSKIDLDEIMADLAWSLVNPEHQNRLQELAREVGKNYDEIFDGSVACKYYALQEFWRYFGFTTDDFGYPTIWW